MLNQPPRWTPRGVVQAVLSGALGVTLLAGAPGSGAAQEMPAIGTTLEIKGQVLITSHGDMAPKSLAEGDRLFEGDRIETGRDSRARLALIDGSLVQVGGSSTLELEWVLYAPALDSRNVILSVPSGIVRFVVEALVPRSSFEVKSDTAISFAEGADWIVATREEQGTWVIALDGEVIVENVRPDVIGKVVLAGSDRTLVPSGEPPQAAEPLPDERRAAYLRRTTLE